MPKRQLRWPKWKQIGPQGAGGGDADWRSFRFVTWKGTRDEIRLEEKQFPAGVWHATRREDCKAALSEVYWARFYDLKTGKPVFPGRDGVLYDTFEAMASNNRVGYDYYSTQPGSLLATDQKKWRKMVGQGAQRDTGFEPVRTAPE